MSSTKNTPKHSIECTIEGHGDFIRPTDIGYKKYPGNSIKKPTIRPPCKKGRRNVNVLKNLSVKQIQRTSSCQNLSGEQNKDFGLCNSNSKSCENITLIGKQKQFFLIGLRQQSKTMMMKGAEEEPQVVFPSAEGDTQRATLDKTLEEEAIMRETFTNFILNAWRNLNKKNKELREENELLKKLESELGLVKQQFEEEQRKAAEIDVENRRSKIIEASCLRKIEKLRTINTQQKQEIDAWKSRLETKEIEYENAKNKYLELENEVTKAKKELDEEREKKDGLQKEKKNLIEKVQSLELIVVEKDAEVLTEIGKMKKQISSKDWEMERFRKEIQELETLLATKDESIASIKKVSDAYMMEVTKIRMSNSCEVLRKTKPTDDNLTNATSVIRTVVFFMLPIMKKILFP
ncbi:mitotic spindle assembly checkpoint protein MAD1 [Nilaparvata lugens]|uniref:mitotic spindle assembly checkpoint protein MAD1 n=1 Tax=Nilaparvata lugens TaxID=108931 RepID=UPI00193E4BE2|nr:mitotic spindle assembly checkpoint protein MAD1 [Nilaparvata lugens]